MENFSLYILTDSNRRFLEIGISSNLNCSLAESQQDSANLFKQASKLTRLVWLEEFAHRELAERKKKELTLYTRMQLEKLIRRNNPNWNHILPRLTAAKNLAVRNFA